MPPIDLKLASALEAAGLHRLAARAREGHYSDFRSQLAAPKMTLCADIRAAGGPLALVRRVQDGDFDG